MGKTELKTSTGRSTEWSNWYKNFSVVNRLPFLPEDWKTRVPQLMKDGYKSKWRNKYFEYLCKMKQSTLKRHLKKVLEGRCYSPISDDGFVYGAGTVPVLLVAHMDTVHSEPVRQVIYKDEFVMSPQGIGGDDRCGVYMVLEVIKKLKCHVLFTEDEEVGCVGASKFSLTDVCKNLNGKINFIVEFDRKNERDAVFYQLDNLEFETFIESTKHFLTDYGSYSDICEIAPVIGAAAVNLSCGYYNPHSTDEYVNLKEMNTNIQEAIKLIEQHDKAYKYTERPRNFYSSYWSNSVGSASATSSSPNYSYWDEDDWDDPYYKSEVLDDGREVFHCGDRDWIYENGKFTYVDLEKEESVERTTTPAIHVTNSWRITYIERDYDDYPVTTASAVVNGKSVWEAFDEFFTEFPYVSDDDIVSIVNVID